MGPRFAIDRPEDGLAEWRSYYEGLSVGVLSEADQPPRDQARFTREPPRPGAGTSVESAVAALMR
jgi:hypothetical protein